MLPQIFMPCLKEAFEELSKLLKRITQPKNKDALTLFLANFFFYDYGIFSLQKIEKTQKSIMIGIKTSYNLSILTQE